MLSVYFSINTHGVALYFYTFVNKGHEKVHMNGYVRDIMYYWSLAAAAIGFLRTKMTESPLKNIFLI